MNVTFLGTGTSTGVPVVGCHCRVCTFDHPKNKRLRQSVKIEENGRTFLIDTTPDLRLQLLRAPIPRLDFILFTHSHADHMMGLDDIRPFNFRQREPIQAYANAPTARAIRRAFSYIWDDRSQLGGGKPQLEIHEVDGAFSADGIDIVPFPSSTATGRSSASASGNSRTSPTPTASRPRRCDCSKGWTCSR